MSSEPRAAEGLQPWAVNPDTSRGRLHPEPGGDARSPCQRDRDRIIHTGAFRRLQYKTQVFVFHEGDYFRTRLTHSIEVAQIARAIARRLRLDEDLAEALALAHDLGHPPFGHAGEEALDMPDAALWRLRPQRPVAEGGDPAGGALRRLRRAEPDLGDAGRPGQAQRPAAPPGRPTSPNTTRRHPLELGTHASAEAQVAALADDIAYNNHDLDDGVRARLFTLEEAARAAADRRGLPGGAGQPIRTSPATGMITETVRRVINAMVQDVVAETRRGGSPR